MIIEKQEGKNVYSDGSHVEREMLEIAKNNPENQATQHIANCGKYTINNTFSAVRENILNWYPFKENSDILEVGAGMGALTGLLCDRARNVVSIEMNANRAEVIRARYPERDNLQILVCDINQWDTEKKFDYVVVIGVLEYAGMFTEGSTPYTTFLNNLRKKLKPDGVLLLAIENQYGLKYWLGSSEDHLQEIYAGINGYEKENTPRTFSKAALEKMLEESGFGQKRFYYCFPDYKFPTAIYSDEATPTAKDIDGIRFTYSRNSILVADEKRIWKDIIDNERLDFFAPSYLVEAGDQLPEYHVIRVNGSTEVKPEYRRITSIDNQGVVKKKATHPCALEHIVQTYENGLALKATGVQYVSECLEKDAIVRKYVNAPIAASVMEECIADGDAAGAIALIEKMRESLLKGCGISAELHPIFAELGKKEEFGIILDHGYIDMAYDNAFIENNELVFFDQEWKLQGVPLSFLQYYGIKRVWLQQQGAGKLTLEELMGWAGISSELQAMYDLAEEKIWSNVLLRSGDLYGEDGYCNMAYATPKLKDMLGEWEKDKRQIKELHAHIDQLVQSERNQKGHIEQLLQSERDQKAHIEQLVQSEQNQKEHIEQLIQSERNQQTQIEQLMQTKSNQKAHIEQLTQTENNQRAHIEQLLQSERDLRNSLDEIKRSRGWKLVNGLWKVRDIVLPLQSRRRVVLKYAVRFLRHPIRFVRKMNKQRIRKVIQALKAGEIQVLTEGVNKVMPEIETVCKPQEVVDVSHLTGSMNISDFDSFSLPQYGTPLVSIIIPVYNQFHYTYACLKSIVENSGDVPYEVIIANDCSTDLTSRVNEIVSGVRVITNKKNLRFLLNCNNAAKAARGKYILFLNNDTQVQKNWLKPLVDLIESDERIGMVGSKLIYPDGHLQEAGGIVWQDGSAWNYGNGQNPENSEYNYVKEVDYISGAAIMIHRKLWKRLGGFDERFAPAYCEDSDLAFKVRDAGYKVMYQPLSVVIHFEGVSNGTNTASGQKAYQVVNQKKFYEKWKNVLEREHNPNAVNPFLARDRSIGKKTLLMVDHYVPTYDKDAGSRTVFQYLKLFASQGYNIKFIGDNFYRSEPYTTALQQMGIEVLYGPEYAQGWKSWIECNADSFDYAFLNRPHIACNYIDWIRKKTKARIVYYGHDLHFLRITREAELSGNKGLLADARKWQERELELMRKADMAYYPSEVEVETIHRIDPSIHAKAIPAYLFEQVDDVCYEADKRQDIMFIGGYTHTPNVDAAVFMAERIIPKLIELIPDIKLHLIGSNAPEHIQRLAGEHIIFDGMVSDEELAAFYRQCRVSVVPLRYGAGIKGKVIEAMEKGLPVMTTSVGAEGIEGAESILCVEDDPERFAARLAELYNDASELKKRSKASIEYIRKTFSPSNAIKVIGEEFDM